MNSSSSPSRRPSGSPSRSLSRAGAPRAATPRQGSITEPLRRTASQRSLAASQAGANSANHTASLPRQPQNAHTAQRTPNGIIPDSPRVTQQPPPIQRPAYQRRHSPLNTKKIDKGFRHGICCAFGWSTVVVPFIGGAVCCCHGFEAGKNYLEWLDDCAACCE